MVRRRFSISVSPNADKSEVENRTTEFTAEEVQEEIGFDCSMIEGNRSLMYYYGSKFRQNDSGREAVSFCLFIFGEIMDTKYKDESEILDLVRSFENATIPHDDWKHAEHLVVALYYTTRHDLEDAYAKMRSGILNLLEHGFKIDLKKEMPYHETITLFWMRAVAEFNASKNGASLLEKANEVAYKWDKDYPLNFYSRELLFSDDARAGFVEPDLVKKSITRD